jgi:hypothetical protein
VPIAVALRLPISRSPSQWPGTRRSSASGGRSAIETVSGMRFVRWPAWRPGLARRASRAQVAGELAFKRAARLHVERLVDRPARHPHLRLVGEAAAQSPGDLLGRQAPSEIVLHDPPQEQVRGQLGRLGATRALERPGVRRRRPVATSAVGVAAQLARDRRRCAAQAARDRTHHLAARPRERDLLTLDQRQATSLEVAAAARAHAAAGRHPARALRAIGAHLRGRVGDELAALQRRPGRLHHLRHPGVDEPRHRHLLESDQPRTTSPRAAGPRRSPHARRSPLRLALRARLRADRRASDQAPRTGPLSDPLSSPCCDHRKDPRTATGTPGRSPRPRTSSQSHSPDSTGRRNGCPCGERIDCG